MTKTLIATKLVEVKRYNSSPGMDVAQQLSGFQDQLEVAGERVRELKGRLADQWQSSLVRDVEHRVARAESLVEQAAQELAGVPEDELKHVMQGSEPGKIAAEAIMTAKTFIVDRQVEAKQKQGFAKVSVDLARFQARLGKAAEQIGFVPPPVRPSAPPPPLPGNHAFRQAPAPPRFNISFEEVDEAVMSDANRQEIHEPPEGYSASSPWDASSRGMDQGPLMQIEDAIAEFENALLRAEGDNADAQGEALLREVQVSMDQCRYLLTTQRRSLQDHPDESMMQQLGKLQRRFDDATRRCRMIQNRMRNLSIPEPPSAPADSYQRKGGYPKGAHYKSGIPKGCLPRGYKGGGRGPSNFDSPHRGFDDSYDMSGPSLLPGAASTARPLGPGHYGKGKGKPPAPPMPLEDVQDGLERERSDSGDAPPLEPAAMDSDQQQIEQTFQARRQPLPPPRPPMPMPDEEQHGSRSQWNDRPPRSMPDASQYWANRSMRPPYYDRQGMPDFDQRWNSPMDKHRMFSHRPPLPQAPFRRKGGKW